MLKKLENAEQKWGGANKLIDQWLSSRRNLLVNYFQVAGLPPYDSDEKSLPPFENVKTFCNLLVDYVSEGHFEVYDQVVTACEKQGESGQTLARELLPKISSSTDFVLDFSDKYTSASSDNILLELDDDLSRLGSSIENRFAYEDELLEVLHEYYS
ncbi:sigma D regulator [Parashewanella spongiae]|uniref:Sigma D regulator n=1 Tax=Parashewanella spongiae TaxID=342950 RepID=A0A3A6TKX2_9GAMM|nr:sigma D regulator [Parashewanella spongiae]MCL1078096.1 sigma D regulator [Parashewanella spongiae]RJY16466.1 sigma D regulator [Parashewanella spongiae]